jgi:flagellar basal body-associated protein FliL
MTQENTKGKSKALLVAIIICSTLIILTAIGGWVYSNQQNIAQKNRQLQQEKELKEAELKNEKEIKEYEQEQINDRASRQRASDAFNSANGF